MSSRLRSAVANTSAAPVAPTAPVAPPPPAVPAPTAPARPNGPFICGACGQGFTRRSSIYLRHWPICRGRQGNPGMRWDSHPSCQASQYNYRNAVPAAPAAPAAPLVATPLVAAPLVAAPVAAASVTAAPAALVATPLAAAALLPAPPAAPTRYAIRRPARHPIRRRRLVAPPAANIIGTDEDDTMSQGEGETAAYGPPRWSQYHYLHVGNWAGKRF